MRTLRALIGGGARMAHDRSLACIEYPLSVTSSTTGANPP